MAEFITIDTTLTKDEIYQELSKNIEALTRDEPDLIANLANTVSVLKLGLLSTTWVGFYLLKGDQLVLAPFQGKPACVRIELGKGVCGTAALRKETIIVPDVSKFPGHIYCDPDSKSEIVVPIIHGEKVYGVLDLDSNQYNAYDEIDRKSLEGIIQILLPNFRESYG